MERTLDVTVLGIATLLYADWIPQWNGSPGALSTKPYRIDNIIPPKSNLQTPLFQE